MNGQAGQGWEIPGLESHAEFGRSTSRNPVASSVLGQTAFRLTAGRLVHQSSNHEHRIVYNSQIWAVDLILAPKLWISHGLMEADLD